MQEFIGVVSAILGAIVGGMVGAGAPLFIDHWYRPMLDLEADRPETGANWSGHGISVTNRGRRTAKSCHGMLILDAKPNDLYGDGQLALTKDLGDDEFLRKFNIQGEENFLLRKSDWRPVDNELLAWSQINNPRNIDIYPNTHPILDVFRLMRVADKPPQLQFVSEGGWQSLRGAFTVREYHLTITVGADNARAAARRYRIRPIGDDVVVEPLANRKKKWWLSATGG